jgi:hypothetical protein
MATREDFVNVRLNALGAKLAGKGELRVIGSKHDFTFKAGEVKEVTKAFDWERVLSKSTATASRSSSSWTPAAARMRRRCGPAPRKSRVGSSSRKFSLRRNNS